MINSLKFSGGKILDQLYRMFLNIVGGRSNKPAETSKSVWDRPELQVNDIIRKMYKERVVYDADNNKIKYTSGVGPVEGWTLYDLVKKNKFSNIAEVGCAFGTSALYICEALKELGGGKLTSIDPFQSTQWKSIAKLNIERAGLSEYHEVIEKTSDIALSELLAAGKKFDLIFVDGMHLFDYTLLDIYFAAKLVNVGGIVVVDDIRHRGVSKCISYIVKNYNFLTLEKNHLAKETMAVFIKKKEDDREWHFHVDF